MIRCLMVLLLAAGTPPPAAAGSGAPAPFYECVDADRSRQVETGGLTLCTARLVRDREEGMPLPPSAVLVTGIEGDSRAAREGLVSGDVIYRVTGATVEEASQAVRRLEARPNGEIRVNFLRNGRPFLVRLPVN